MNVKNSLTLKNMSNKEEFGHLALRLVCYLRYRRQILYISKEFKYCNGFFIADVAALHNNLFYEYEIKSSWTDFKKDFNKCHPKLMHKESRKKHDYIADRDGPAKFYFCFPSYNKKLIGQASEYLEKHYPKYGVISIGEKNFQTKTLRPAKKIHHEIEGGYRLEALKEAPTTSLASVAFDAVYRLP